MSGQLFTRVKLAALVISAFGTLYSVGSVSGWKAEAVLSSISLWAVSPYFIFFVASQFAERFSPNIEMKFVGCLISTLMLIFTIMAYVAPAHDSGAWVYVFLLVPFYLIIGSFLFLVVGFLVAKLART